MIILILKLCKTNRGVNIIITYLYVIGIMFVFKLFGFNLIQINQNAKFIKYIDLPRPVCYN